MVIEPDDTKLHQLALNSGYVEKALRYLHALQLMVIIIRPAALAAAPQFTRAELDELADRFTFLRFYLFSSYFRSHNETHHFKTFIRYII